MQHTRLKTLFLTYHLLFWIYNSLKSGRTENKLGLGMLIHKKSRNAQSRGSSQRTAAWFGTELTFQVDSQPVIAKQQQQHSFEIHLSIKLSTTELVTKLAFFLLPPATYLFRMPVLQEKTLYF